MKLDAIKDRIIVVRSHPVEDAVKRANQGALWHFLLDGQPVSLVCPFPKGEPSQDGDRAKEFLARDLYIKDPANRMTIKAVVRRDYIYERRMTINVSVPKCASDKEKLEFAIDAAIDEIDEFIEFNEKEFHFVDLDDTIESIDGRRVPIEDEPCICCGFAEK